ncbi:tyrosine recombinase XerC [Geodermatophilus sp. SYSU D00758]
MPRPRNDLGEWGRVTMTGFVFDENGNKQRAPEGARKADTWQARARVRDLDGKLRSVESWRSTREAARRALMDKLRNRVAPAPAHALVKPTTTVAEVAGRWLADLADADLSTNTRQVYRLMCQRHVIGPEGRPSSLANLAVREVTAGGVERFLTEVAKASGKGAARTVRTVLRGVLDVATKDDAIPHNPVRSAGPFKVRTTRPKGTREAERSFTEDERDAVVAFAETDPVAIRRDLGDLVAFLAGTGARIGEVCALRWSALDLAEGTATLGPVVVRETGKGVHIQADGKTDSSTRTIKLPADLVARLLARQVNAVANEWDVVFPSPMGRLRDPSNTSHDVRDLMRGAGYEWATAHTFRHTVATLLGLVLTAREVANYLGHGRASMTMDRYMSRTTMSERAAELLVIGR